MANGPAALLPEILGQRLRGIGTDLSPQFDALRTSLTERSRASEGAQLRQVLERSLTMGTGRSGSAAAAQRGVSATAAGQRRGIGAQLGLQEQQGRQSAIENAIRAALQGRGFDVQESLGMRRLDIDEERLELQRRQLEDALKDPGFLEILGSIPGLAASLFGAGGAFPKAFGKE